MLQHPEGKNTKKICLLILNCSKKTKDQVIASYNVNCHISLFDKREVTINLYAAFFLAQECKKKQINEIYAAKFNNRKVRII